MLKKTLVACGIGVLSVVTILPSLAQQVATLALRNGERPSGELIDLNASGFTLRVDGQEQRFSADDVAAVEFTVGPPPAAVQAKVAAGQAVVLLRNGQVIDARLTDIGGSGPLRLTFDTPSGSRDYSSNDVAQIHLHPVSGASAAAASQAVARPAASVVVQGNQSWTSAGITVARGERIVFQGSGDIKIAPDASSGVGGSPAVTDARARYPVPLAPVGALIGRVGRSRPFPIGASHEPITMPAAGPLLLGVNDTNLGDNTGAYTVTVTSLGK